MHQSTKIWVEQQQTRLDARRTELLDALGVDEAKRHELEALSTAHLIALSHIRPALFEAADTH